MENEKCAQREPSSQRRLPGRDGRAGREEEEPAQRREYDEGRELSSWHAAEGKMPRMPRCMEEK